MKTQKLASIAGFPALLAMGGFLEAFAPAPVSALTYNYVLAVADNAMTDPAPDHSIMNSSDEANQDTTADQAGNRLSDRKIMQKIRKHLISDSTLSTDAQNVKVISQNGKVTLKGPVDSDAEKRSVATKAARVVGGRNVTDDLMVKDAR